MGEHAQRVRSGAQASRSRDTPRRRQRRERQALGGGEQVRRRNPHGGSHFLEFTPYGAERPQYLSRAHILTLTAIDIPKTPPLYERRGSGDADDPHHILGVPAGSAWHDVREAYVKLAKAYRPDRFSSVALPEEVTHYLGSKARTINAAYAVLETSMRQASNAGKA